MDRTGARATTTAARSGWLSPPGIARLGTPIAFLALFLLLALVPVFPQTSGRSDIFFWNEVLIFILFASSLNLLIGYSGMVSFGHAAYYGAGVYAVGVAVVRWDSEMMLLNILFGMAIGTLFALLVGALIVRTAGLAFSILTLAFGQLAATFAFQTDYLGGENGLAGIIRGEVGPLDLRPDENYYWFCLALVFVALAAIWLVVHSPLGLTLRSIREDAARAEFLGIRVRLYRLAVFTFAGALAGLAGALRAYHNIFANNEELSVVRNAEPIIMTILGGVGTFLGPAIGAIGYLWIEEWLQEQTVNWIFWIGLLLVAMILFLPGGLVGALQIARRRIRTARISGWRPRWRNLPFASKD